MGGEGRGLGGQIELLARLSLEIGDLLLSPFEALNLHTLCFLLSIFYLSSLLGPCRCLEGGWGGRGTIHPCAPETLQSPTQAVRRTHSRASGNHCPVETTAQWQGDSAALTPEKSSISQSVLMCVVLEVPAEACRGDKGVFPISH